MTERSCSFEASVIDAVNSGDWSPELEAHRNSCLSCAELTLVVSALRTDAEELADLDVPLPDPAPVWLRARLAARERDFRRATRAIVWVQRAALAVAVAIGLAFAPRVWDVMSGAVRGFDLGLPVAELPRAAGSPMLVVVCSLVVLGLLAIWELAAVHEN